jgi:hypothetical protein
VKVGLLKVRLPNFRLQVKVRLFAPKPASRPA